MDDVEVVTSGWETEEESVEVPMEDDWREAGGLEEGGLDDFGVDDGSEERLVEGLKGMRGGGS